MKICKRPSNNYKGYAQQRLFDTRACVFFLEVGLKAYVKIKKNIYVMVANDN